MGRLQFQEIKFEGEQIPYVHRDISWLDFNYRVLQEAKDTYNPLFERIKFLAIYSNNLDEFFRVRVANNRNLIRLEKKTKRQLGSDPTEVQDNIIDIVNRQQIEFSDIFFKEIIPELKQHSIRLVTHDQLTKEQHEYIDSYFQDYMLPFVQPMLLKRKKIKPFLNNAALYLAIHLKDKSRKKPQSEFAIVRIPSNELPRFITLPSKDKYHTVIYLDDIVRAQIEYFFPGYHIIESHSLKLSRDAELYIDDEFSGDLIEKISASLSRRKVGPASRLVYDRDMPPHMLKYFVDLLEVSNMDLFKEGRYHNNFDLFSFPNFDLRHLHNKTLKPIAVKALEQAPSIFEAIKKQDHLIHMPYHSYRSVIQFFEQAAEDPLVTHIKVVQYRVAAESRIMNALIKAVKNGKHVSVFVEVKARFDEKSNLTWGKKLEENGIQVQYSFPGLKVHAKIALVRRREGRYLRNYCYLSTGNFHEKTVKIYSDIGLFTRHTKLCQDVVRVFKILESGKPQKIACDHLLVGQVTMRAKLEKLIRFEIAEALAGRKAEISLKMNSLQDVRMIKLLYEASKAGVKLRLIIRGICCLVPSLKPWSKNIKAISIVDRYLEHSRIYWFHHGGKELIYSGSADWMERNLSRRIETLFPILDDSIKNELIDFFDMQWNDNTKSRYIHPKKNNHYKSGSSVMQIQSQIEMYFYYKRKENQHAQ